MSLYTDYYLNCAFSSPRPLAGLAFSILKALQICIGINHCKNQYRKLGIDLQLVLVPQGLWQGGVSLPKALQICIGLIDFYFNVSLKLTVKYNWHYIHFAQKKLVDCVTLSPSVNLLTAHSQIPDSTSRKDFLHIHHPLL